MMRWRRIANSQAGMSALSIGVIVATWHVGASLFDNPVVLPGPIDVGWTAWAMVGDETFVGHVVDSLRRVGVAFFWGGLFGLALGVLLAQFESLFAFLEVSLDFIRSIPPIAFVPLAIVWLGIGETAKYVVIAYLIVIIVAYSTRDALREVSRQRVRAGRCLGLSGWGMYRRVIIPSAAGPVLATLRLMLGMAFISLVAVELIGATSGLGFVIMNSRLLLQTPQMIVAIIILAILGVLSVAAFNLLLRLFGLDRYTRVVSE